MSKSPKKKPNLSQAEASQTSSQSSSQQESEPGEFRILIATDIHLGFAEKDPIRGEYMNSLESIDSQTGSIDTKISYYV